MLEDTGAGGPVSRSELEELATLFDAWEYAINPMAASAKEARSRFEDRAMEIFERIRHLPAYQSIDYRTFVARLRTLYRQFLRRNR